MNQGANSFDDAFEGLTGHRPFPWQRRLYDEWFSKGDVPDLCNLPTGLGKTSVMAVWLIALAHASNARSEKRLPRRLVYVVNRRTVVDQATDEAAGFLELIKQPATAGNGEGAICRLRDALARSAGDSNSVPLAVSTLRGELADNGEWKQNPARPAIIVGTIDMIGSKLLFSGYGDGRYGRAHHAGLMGQDALIVHDEAHLSPAFSRLLWTVEHEQRVGEKPCGNRNGCISVMELSATTRQDDETERLRSETYQARSGGTAVSFGIEAEGKQDCLVQRRLEAKKTLSFPDTGGTEEPSAPDKAAPPEAAEESPAAKKKKNRDDLADNIAKAALQHVDKGCRVLVYVRSPEAAASVRHAITKGIVRKSKEAGHAISEADVQQRVGLLTGTIRGYERDELARSELFRTFRSDPNRPAQLDQTLYLVSTSAGEVGVDLDADHLVCDLTTLDSMAQRFGRVNRLGVDKDGKPREATITVVVEKPKESKKAAQPAESTPTGAEGGKKDKNQHPLDAAIARTGEILRRIAHDGGDVSPAALATVFAGLSAEDMSAAFSPAPTILPATDILFDHWSLTSIAGELPGRPEVAPYLHGVAEWEPPETYVAWRAELSELDKAGVTNDDLEEVFDAFPIRAAERLRDRTDRVFEELRKVADRVVNDPRVVLIKQNNVQWVPLSELAPAAKRQKDAAISRLAYSIVVLPVEAGGLKDGTLDGGTPPPANPTALDVAEATASGQRVRRRVWISADDAETPLIADGPDCALPCTLRITLADDEEAEDEVEGGSRKVAIEYRVERTESGEPGAAVTLQDHASAVMAAAESIGRALGLDDSIREAVSFAARRHDAGKARAVWQRYARNGDPGAAPLAKAPRYLHPKELGGYRHEFGSLLDAARCAGGTGPPVDEASQAGEIANHRERDLILHLIAAHHGWGRPHFEPRAFDRERPTSENEAAAVEAMQRFGRLQQRFGRWGLAWLESLLRCADALASANAEPSDPSRDREGAVAADISHTATSETCVGGSA